MNVNHKLQLLDQMDDAAFALMMDEYAESEGERLRSEFEADMRSGLTPHKPDGLDDKCRTIIKKEYGRQRRREYAAKARKFTAKAAAAVLIALGITAATIMSVEAFRVPFFKLITTHYSDKSVIDYESTIPIETDATQTESYDPVLAILPSGFEPIVVEIQNGRLYGLYSTIEGSTIMVSMNYCTPNEAPSFDNESNTYVELGEVTAIYTFENVRLMEWYCPELETEFRVSADLLSEEEFMDLCKAVVGIYQNATLVNGGGPDNALLAVLPMEYQELCYYNIGGLLSCAYQSSEEQMIYFDMWPMEGKHAYDTEDTTITDTTIGGYEALSIKDDIFGDIEFIWFDEERQIVFCCIAAGYEDAQIRELCEYLAEYYKDVTLPAVSTVLLP